MRTDRRGQAVGVVLMLRGNGSCRCSKVSGLHPDGVRSHKVGHRRPLHLPHLMDTVSTVTLLTLN